jgi:hypothetical protein
MLRALGRPEWGRRPLETTGLHKNGRSMVTTAEVGALIGPKRAFANGCVVYRCGPFAAMSRTHSSSPSLVAGVGTR